MKNLEPLILPAAIVIMIATSQVGSLAAWVVLVAAVVGLFLLDAIVRRES